MKAVIKILVLGSVLAAYSACSAKAPEPIKVSAATETVVLRQTVNELERETVPGTVTEVWEEPMIDTVCQPGQIDASGTYYRKGVCTVAEVRRGKYQQVQYPDDHNGVRAADDVRGAQ